MKVAKIAVSGVPFRLDKPYDYSIPEHLEDKIVPGVRVMVPFTRANRSTEGIVLAVSPDSSFEKLKPVASALDTEPVLSQKLLSLAMWMHERFFCTVYEAVKAMLPAGLWFKGGKQRVHEKYVTMAELDVPAEEAMDAAQRKRLRAPMQAEILQDRKSVV